MFGKFRAQPIKTTSSSKIAKRPRQSQVCNQCQISKLKCDRGQPCGSCAKRDETEACSYQRMEASRAQIARNTPVEERLKHLESLVMKLMPETSGGGQSRKVAPDNLTISLRNGIHEEEFEEVRYVGSTHWSAIMDDIHELKIALGSSSLPPCGENQSDLRGELIFGQPSDYSLQNIISQNLPPKAETDLFLSTFFQGEAFIIPFIHISQFRQQYEAFWEDPDHVNPLWLSLLFSVCYKASLAAGPNNPYRKPQEGPITGNSRFHVAAGQCLVLGGYHYPQKFAPEALVAYANSKSLSSLDPSREALQIFGLVVRMAYEMGYHRDPDSLKGFSVLEGEMRRRFWSVCKQMDLMISFQFGLPTNIRLDNCDTRSPGNLLDSDFSMDTRVLPPSRPESEATRLLWFIVKDRLMLGFAKVCQYALSFAEKPGIEVLELDQEIRHLHTTIPDALRARPFFNCKSDEPLLIMLRLFIEFIHLKSLCVLHRRYMARGVDYSAQTCIEAGTKLVGQFVEMYQEFRPGGQLYEERWLLNTFMMNDFLLGVMVLCLAIHTRHGDDSQNCNIGSRAEKKILSLLEESLVICIEKSTASKDSRKVSQVIRLTLDRAQQQIKEFHLPLEQSADLATLSLQSLDTSFFNYDTDFVSLDPFNFMDNDATTNFEYDYTFFDQHS